MPQKAVVYGPLGLFPFENDIVKKKTCKIPLDFPGKHSTIQVIYNPTISYSLCSGGCSYETFSFIL